MEFVKTKSAFKSVLPRGKDLKKKVLDTMSTVATVVGGTLGPGGHPVLIERQEHGLPPVITKDGVTVFRALGFQDSIAHCIMEAARDASVRTANEAGDGTTTATILAEAFVRETEEFCASNPKFSPQRVIQQIRAIHTDVMVPELARLTVRGDLVTDEGRRRLHAVATISGNGDKDLADAVMKCFDICGDEGNVQIVESSGASEYEVEQIKGYPLAMGYEESCRRFAPAFINRPELQQIAVEKPIFVLYFGMINDIQTLVPLMTRLQDSWAGEYLKSPNVVVVATGFSDSVIASLMTNLVSPTSLNIFPLLVPNDSPIHNAQRNLLDDLAAVVGAEVYDPITKPLETAEFGDLGNLAQDEEECWVTLGVDAIEIARYRTTILGICQEDILLERAAQVKAQVEQAESTLDAELTRERLAKLTGGIAKLKVVGSSNGEVKERRDRAEDAVCAVRGAVKHGCYIGGSWMLLRLAHILPDTDVANFIVRPALRRPLHVLLQNSGVSEHEAGDVLSLLEKDVAVGDPENATVWDAAEGHFVSGLQSGLLDSAPAVREALKNSISIATLLGTLGGCIVFPRDLDVERKEAHASAEWERMSKVNPADERAF